VSIEDTLARIEATLDRIEATLRVQPSAAPSPWVLASQCGLPATTRKRLTREGRLATSKVGRSLMVRRADVEHFIESQRIEPGKGDELDRTLRLVGTRGTR
jgi:hypothetical protein